MIPGARFANALSLLASLFLFPFLLTGCVSDAPDRSGNLLREGRFELSETQSATFFALPNPGLLRLREDFSERARVGSSFVLSETGDDGRRESYCRLTSGDWQSVVLAQRQPPDLSRTG